MKKGLKISARKNCTNCAHSNPVMENLSVKSRKPILSECIYSEHYTLLNHHSCENYKKK